MALFRPGELLASYQGLMALMAAISQAISLLPPIQRAEFMAEWNALIHRMTKQELEVVGFNIKIEDAPMKAQAELKNGTWTLATSITQRAGAKFNALRIEARAFNSRVQAALKKEAQTAPPAEAVRKQKAAAILGQSDKLYEKDVMFADSWDSVADMFRAIQTAMADLVGGLWKVALLVGGGLVGWWVYKNWLSKPQRPRAPAYARR